MLMFELIWIERGLALEAEGNNICKNLGNKGYGNFKGVQKFLQGRYREYGTFGHGDER